MSKKNIVKNPSTSEGENVAKPIKYGVVKRIELFVLALYQFANDGLVSGRTGGDVKMRNGRSRKMTVPALVRNRATQGARSILSNISSLWNTLTVGEIASWNNYFLTASNRFGVKQIVKGKSAFVRVNANLTYIGLGTTILPTYGTTVEAVELSGVIAIADTSMNLHYTPVSGHSTGLIYATRNFSTGTSRPSQSAFRLIGTGDFTSPSPISIGTLYTAKFGSYPSGARIFVQVRNIDMDGGLGSPITQVDFIVH